MLVSHDKFASGAKVSLTDQEKKKNTRREKFEFIFFCWLAHSRVVLAYPFQNEMKIKWIRGPSFFEFNGSVFMLFTSVVCFHKKFAE